MKGYFVSFKKKPLITERSVKSLPFYVLKDSLSVVISLDRSIPTIFQQFSLSSTVHNVHVEDCPLCPVLFGIVAIMLDMVMVMVVMDIDMVLTMVMSSVMALRTVTYNCSLKLHLQRRQ